MPTPEVSELIALADRMERWIDEPFVQLTPMRAADMHEFIATLRANAASLRGGDSVNTRYQSAEDNEWWWYRIKHMEPHAASMCEELLRTLHPTNPAEGVEDGR